MSQPEPKSKAKKAKLEDNKLPKITNWLNSSQPNAIPSTVPQAKPSSNKPGGFTKMNGGGTVVLKPTASNRTSTATTNENTGSILSSVSDATAGRNLGNVVGFRDLNDSGNSKKKKSSI